MKPLTREALFERYQKSSKEEWETYIQTLTVPSHAVTAPLYHMSFTEVPAGLWAPKNTVKGESQSEAHPIYGEMLPNRISVSTSLEGCWAGIFCYLIKQPNIGKEITAFIYKATPQRGCRILTTEVLSNYFLVQDAHLTDEHCLLGDAQMVLERKITIKNTFNVAESKWIKSHPFNEKRYGNLHYPPFVILNNETINQETSMSDFKITPSVNTIRHQISTEARVNPLSMLNEGMANSFTVLLTQMDAVNNGVAQLAMRPINYAFKPRKLRHITDNNNYMQLMNYGAAVPPGFIGPLVPYMGLLAEMLNLFKNIRSDVTKPMCVEIGTMLGNPDRMRSSSMSPLSRINFHDKEREAFKKRVASYYSPDSTRDEIAFSRLFNDNSEFLKAGAIVTTLEHLLKDVSLELKDVLADTREISGLTDKLAIRITQDKITYGINAAVANDLAIAVTKVAECVSYLAVIITMGEEAIGILDNLAAKIK